MRKRPTVRALIFDMDGVLWRSTPIHDRAFRRVLKAAGIRKFDYRSIAGMKTKAAFEKIFLQSGTEAGPKVIEQCSKEKSRLAFEMLKRRPPVAKGTARMIVRLSRRFTLGLATSAGRKTVNVFLRALGQRRKFRIVVTGDDVLKAKPAPDLYLAALRGVRVKPSEAFVIEDAVLGVRAARAAGIRTLGITGTDSARRLRAAGAITVARSLSAIERYVERF